MGRFGWAALAAVLVVIGILARPPEAEANTAVALYLLDRIEDHDRRIRALTAVIEGFAIEPNYCLPPQTPGKEADRGALAELERTAKALRSGLHSAGVRLLNIISNDGRANNAVLARLPAGANPQDPGFWALYNQAIAAMNQALAAKKQALEAAPERDCTPVQPAQPSVTTPTAPAGPGVEIYEPEYYEVTTPVVPDGPLCSEEEKFNIVQAVGAQRINAAENSSRAQIRVADIAEKIALGQGDRAVLERLLEEARAESARREQIYQEIDALYQKARALQVVDCPEETGSLILEGTGEEGAFATVIEGEATNGQVAGPAPGPELAIGYRNGEIELGKAYYLRTEFGGVVLDPKFLEFDRELDYEAVDAQFTLPGATLGLGEGWGKGWSFSLGGSYGWADGSAFQPFADAQGNQSCALGPEGAGGTFDGGVCAPAGFADVYDARYEVDYEEGFVGLSAGYRYAFAAAGNLGNLVNLGNAGNVGGAEGGWAEVNAGLFYGWTDEKARLTGSWDVGGNVIPFEYRDQVSSDRVGLEVGAQIQQPLYRFPQMESDLGLYGGGALRFVQNWADGRSMLEVQDIGSESQSASRSFFDVGGVLGGGVYLDAGPLTLRAGAEWETWSIPQIAIPDPEEVQPQPATIEKVDRDSLTLRIGVGYKF